MRTGSNPSLRAARPRVLGPALALALLLPGAALAHDCQILPGNVLKVPLNSFGTYRITADVAESQKSDYALFNNSEPAIASVHPLEQSTFNHAEFLVRGRALGSSIVVLSWAYAPFSGSGSCTFTVEVVEPTVNTGANAPNSVTVGDPVNSFTGELVLEPPPDLHLGGPLPLEFRRHYASAKDLDGLSPSPLGHNWTHNFDWRLRHESDLAVVSMPDGRVARFLLDGATWQLQGVQPTPFALRQEVDAWRFADPRGNLVYSFDAGGALTGITDGQGNALALSYSGQNLSQVSDGKGRVLSLSYAGLNRLVTVGDGSRTISLSHNFKTLASVTDADGFVTQYVYNGTTPRPGLLTEVRRPLGNVPWRQAYGTDGRVLSQTDAFGHATQFAYGAGSTTITAPDGSTRVHAYGSDGRLLSETDETGRRIRYAYDAAGRLATVTDRLGRVTRRQYHAASGKLARLTDPRGNYTQWGYGARTVLGLALHDATSLRQFDGSTETWQRNAQGLLTRRTDAAGGIWTLQYNAFGQPLRLTNPAGGVELSTYFADGNLASHATASGSKTYLKYDPLRRLSRIERPDGTVRTVQRNGRDLVTRVVDERGGITRHSYDDNGNRVGSTDPLGRTGAYGYDSMDRLDTWRDPDDAAARRLQYDARGYVDALVRPNGETLALEPDARGATARLVDGAGHAWTRVLDDELRTTTQADPVGRQWQFAWDAGDNALSMTEPGGRAWETAFDAMDRPVERRQPDGLVTTQSFDAAGRLTGIAGPAPAASAELTVDALGRRDTIARGGLTLRDVDHDAAGRLVAVADGLGRRTEYGYDLADRAATVSFADGGTLAIDYEGIGDVRRRAFSDGLVLDYDYDLAGRLASATGIVLARNAQGQVVGSNGIEHARDDNQRLVSLTFAPGVTVTYSYDAVGQLVGVQDALGGGLTLSWDDSGKLVGLARASGLATQYEYDADGRLRTLREGALAERRLTRDANGRIASVLTTLPAGEALDAASVVQAYDAADQVAGWSWDPRGRLLADGTRSFAWDGDSRLATVVGTAVSRSYTYDGFGQRLSAAGGGDDVEFVWNYATPLPSVAIERQGGSDERYHVPLPDGTLAYTILAGSGAHLYPHHDERGNTSFLSDDAGRIVERYRYGAFGEPIAAASAVGNRFTWQGRFGVQYDEPSGLYYLRARWYDPRAGRFLTRDPVHTENPRAQNAYAYAMNDPVGLHDPQGLSPQPVSSGPPTGPGSSPDNPIHLSDQEWQQTVSRLKYEMRKRIERAEWGWYDPSIPASFDSPFIKGERVFQHYHFRGQVMIGGELNYYFQGMYWGELGVSKDVMIGIIYGYKRGRYKGRLPSANDLFAASQGWADHMGSSHEIRAGFLAAPEALVATPMQALGLGNPIAAVANFASELVNQQ